MPYHMLIIMLLKQIAHAHNVSKTLTAYSVLTENLFTKQTY